MSNLGDLLESANILFLKKRFTDAISIYKKIIEFEGTGADAFSIAQNNGKAAKQIIPHVHVHIIPRFSNKGTVWTKRSMPSDSELKELSENIKKQF